MRIKLTKSIDFVDSAGEDRFRLEPGSVHDWGIAEAKDYVDAGIAVPADDEAAAFLAKFEAMSEADQERFRTGGRAVGVGDAAAGADAAG